MGCRVSELFFLEKRFCPNKNIKHDTGHEFTIYKIPQHNINDTVRQCTFAGGIHCKNPPNTWGGPLNLKFLEP